MRILYILLFCGVAFLILSCQSNSKPEGVDLILFNGAVWTVNPDQPWAEAVAVTDDKIVSVGSTEDILKLRGAGTKSIDCESAFVLPGFIDSHTHFLNGGFSLSSVQLYEVKSREEFIARIKNKAETCEADEWILNGDWDHQKFDPPDLPRKEWIDPVTSDIPVCINRHDGHMALVNSLALKIAGITKVTVSPQGGEILKDPDTGEPTGILKDAAMDLVTRHIPEPTLEQKVKAAETALKMAARLGVTSIHDMNYEESCEALVQLFRDNRLTARIYGYTPISRPESFAVFRSKTPPDSGYLKAGGLKGFVDGSLGSSTALFFDPYSDNPETTGLLAPDMLPEGVMAERIRQADQAGLQLAVHAIGDRANHIILDVFEEIVKEKGVRDRRWRIEHAQHLIPEDMGRFKELGIIASVQPYHAIDDGRWAEEKIGKSRARTTYAFKSLLDTGAVLACGSDWTVAPLNPLTGISAAVSRQTVDGKNPGGWYPEQKITLEEAIRGYTINGAYTEFAEETKGSLEEGKLADIVVLDLNLFEVPPEKILLARVLMTIVGGTVIYEK
ncbi:MAG: amidohydrolase [Candidatus Aminicenantes bacterium]|jgi:predicted amidohydrolase YtcJ